MLLRADAATLGGLGTCMGFLKERPPHSQKVDEPNINP